PFRYGIATLTQLPHLLARIELELDGQIACGWAADGLAPKWFSKDAAKSPSEEIAEMLEVIRAAFALTINAGESATPFDLWREVYGAQMRWAESRHLPPLLANFGTSFVERAMIDAFCRITKQTFAQALRSDALGIR